MQRFEEPFGTPATSPCESPSHSHYPVHIQSDASAPYWRSQRSLSYQGSGPMHLSTKSNSGYELICPTLGYEGFNTNFVAFSPAPGCKGFDTLSIGILPSTRLEDVQHFATKGLKTHVDRNLLQYLAPRVLYPCQMQSCPVLACERVLQHSAEKGCNTRVT